MNAAERGRFLESHLTLAASGGHFRREAVNVRDIGEVVGGRCGVEK